MAEEYKRPTVITAESGWKTPTLYVLGAIIAVGGIAYLVDYSTRKSEREKFAPIMIEIHQRGNSKTPGDAVIYDQYGRMPRPLVRVVDGDENGNGAVYMGLEEATTLEGKDLEKRIKDIKGR